MKYKVTHTTTYEYSELVPVCQNQLHQTPRNLPHQTCTYHRLQIQPKPSTSSRRNDYFGNQVHQFEILQPHKRLQVTASSRVDVQLEQRLAADATPSWEDVRGQLPRDLSREGLEAYQFVFDSPRVACSTELFQYAQPSFPADRPIAEAALDLTHRIHGDFSYDAEATSVHSTLAEVLELRRGVCQDLAHVMIGCLRSLGLAARYVSGYLRTEPPPGQPRLVGADASHAWCAVYCGPGGWWEFDPTNDVLASVDHIRVAWGRDFEDVVPLRGMFIGGGRHAILVSVDVEPVEQDPG